MHSLSISQIQTLLRQNKLPSQYKLQTPLKVSSANVVRTLKLFNDNASLKTFIELLSTNPNVIIQVNKKEIRQGTAAKFVHAYTEHSLMPTELDESKQNEVLSYFKEYHFETKQLYYLLKNLSYEAINEFLLKTNCFSRVDLLTICNNLEAIKKLPDLVFQSLYHFFNKSRKWKESETPVLDMYYFAYRAGHVMGLSQSIIISKDLSEHELETEYAPAEVSLRILCEFIEAYSQRCPSKEFDAIKTATKANLSQFLKNDSRYKKNAHIEISKQYHRGELTFLSCGWPGHAVAVVLYGDYLIYTNRGIGCDPRAGSKIFKMRRDAIINQPFVRRLLIAPNMNDFHQLLGGVIDFKNPVVRFRSKPQKYANCTFVNPKSAIEPMMVLLQAGSKATEAELKRVAHAERFRTKYKRFTSFVRNREIDEMVKNMFYAQNDILIQFYIRLVETIILRHHGKNKKSLKDRQERLRALDLYRRTPERIQRGLQNNKQVMEIINEIQDENIDEQRAHYRWDTYMPVHFIRKDQTLKVEIFQGYIAAINGVPTPKMTYSLRNVRKLSTAILK